MTNYFGKCTVCQKDIINVDDFFIEEYTIVNYLGEKVSIQKILCKTCNN